MNRLLIIDGNAMMHRAYHAIPPLTAPDGSVVNVVYGFATMMLRLHQNLAPSHMAVTFDRPAPTFRKTLFPGYQSKRPKMEDSLSEQIPKVHGLVEAFGIPIFEKDGFEADDVIGTLAKRVTSGRGQEAGNRRQETRNEGQGREGVSRVSCDMLPIIDQVVIVTGDRDILQLVDGDRIMVYMPTKGITEGKIYHEKEVIERLGVAPHAIPDYKGLAGDSSDNYPGVEGIGPKTAIELLSKFNTVEGVYAFIDSLSEKSGIMNTEEWKKHGLSQGALDKLLRGKEMAFLSKDLATIRTNVSIDISLPQVPTLNTKSSREALSEYHFHSLLKRMGVTSVNNESGIRNDAGDRGHETGSMGQGTRGKGQGAGDRGQEAGEQQELF